MGLALTPNFPSGETSNVGSIAVLALVNLINTREPSPNTKFGIVTYFALADPPVLQTAQLFTLAEPSK